MRTSPQGTQEGADTGFLMLDGWQTVVYPPLMGLPVRSLNGLATSDLAY